MNKVIFLFIVFLLSLHLNSQVITGLENLLLFNEKKNLIRGKRIGLVTNPTGINRNLQSTIDLFHNEPEITLVALFAPEHGIRGNIPAGKFFDSYIDEKTKLPVFSIYKKRKAPTEEQWSKIDTLVYDIQDIGSRAYTFIWTLSKIMESASKYGKEVIVLDRPNPLGNVVDGAIIDKSLTSFIGLYPIPRVYGMTIGELAQFLNKEFNINCQLSVIRMKNYRRSMSWEETGLPWVATSPHIPNIKSALCFSMTGGLGTIGKVNIGVGYTLPFQTIAAPWIDSLHMSHTLNSISIPGIHFRPIHYKPFYGIYKNEHIQGVQIHITNSKVIRPASTEILLAWYLLKFYPNHFFIERKKYDHIAPDFVTESWALS